MFHRYGLSTTLDRLTLSLPTILFDEVSSQDHSPGKARQTKKPLILITVFYVSIRKELELKAGRQMPSYMQTLNRFANDVI